MRASGRSEESQTERKDQEHQQSDACVRACVCTSRKQAADTKYYGGFGHRLATQWALQCPSEPPPRHRLRQRTEAACQAVYSVI